jgi:hypothetical protein
LILLQRKKRGRAYTDPESPFPRGDIRQAMRELAVLWLRVGQKRAARTREISLGAFGELISKNVYGDRQRVFLIQRGEMKRLTLIRGKREDPGSVAQPQMEREFSLRKALQVAEMI